MDINLSLDDIIKNKGSKTKTSAKSLRTKNGKTQTSSWKPTKFERKKSNLRRVRKSNASPMKMKQNPRKTRSIPVMDARLKLSKVSDARQKINRSKNRASNHRSPLLTGNGSLLDARMKIEAHKQMKQTKQEQRRKPSGITTIGGDGIIERRINANIVDNGIHVEYEDDDMNLEYETLSKENWSGRSLLVRRTIQNNLGWKNSAMVSDEDRSRDYRPPSYNESRSFKDVTRTISNSNYERLPANNVTRRPYSRRSPVHQNDSFSSSNRKTRSLRSSSPSYSSPMLRNAQYHLVVISNLHENVTGEDIKELFEDVGDLVYAKMIKDGVAEVAYKSQRDAMKAVEIYHNRQLDGLPMKCVLMPSHHDSSSRSIPPINTPFSPVHPDAHLIKKALFSSH